MFTRMKVPKRYFLATALLFTLLLALYYLTYISNTKQDEVRVDIRDTVIQAEAGSLIENEIEKEEEEEEENEIIDNAASCPSIELAKTDVDTVDTFKQFEFQPYWMKSKEYWDASFEQRYKNRKAKSEVPLKVVAVLHSHNDPGWLKTYESYFHYQSRSILNNMVEKMQQYKNMTFIWTEISFFALWWESAHPTKRKVVLKLLEEGRLEITTGGWVMTDEATSHLYAMLDQMIEGHQWVKNNLGISPKTGWSIDPFGHGATVPYLLRSSGINATIIQRIHYAWKQWLAQKQMGDFIWRQAWASGKETDILTHNQPFDIYSIKHSCGPHPQVCLNFDFRKLSGEYTDYTAKAAPIDKRNVREKADLLIEQYGRTASLFPHNVVLMPIGDDFRFDHEIEWDQQYLNYQRLFNYINENPERYNNSKVSFGTPSDYFKAVNERMNDYRTLRGDFFVYSDIFSEGRPAYWSGYFTTRPYWKQLDRQVEANLRSAEILYTVALTRARQHGANKTAQLLERDFEKLVKSRRHLALFQHHDAITGTSKAFVMHDYAMKLFEGLQSSIEIQSRSAHALLLPASYSARKLGDNLLSDIDRESYEQLPRKVPQSVPINEPRRIVLFNSLGQERQEITKLRLTNPYVRVLNAKTNAIIPCQINPVWNNSVIINGEYEVIWIADLPPLSFVTYIIERVSETTNVASRALVYCSECTKPSNAPIFEIRTMKTGDVQLENHKMRLLFDERTGFLKAITRKATEHTTPCSMQFSAYPSAQFHSGAYLFMPDPNSREPEKEVFQDSSKEIVIISGPISSEITVTYGKLLSLTVTVYHAAGILSEAIQLQTLVDFDTPPKNRETELFMRFITDISNGQGAEASIPQFYTDQNGFQMQRRLKVERIGIEGNYFPITTMTYLQDSGRRLSVLVDHAMGAASWQPGWLEVMLDRRTLYDDSRGMGEGVVDNKPTLSKFWLLLEEVNESIEESFSTPSLFANHLSNSLIYPANLFIIEGSEGEILNTSLSLLSKSLPCDVHIVNLRTLADTIYSRFPSNSALMILHRQGYNCKSINNNNQCSQSQSNEFLNPSTKFNEISIADITVTSLTGLYSDHKLNSLDKLKISPMTLTSLNLTFIL